MTHGRDRTGGRSGELAAGDSYSIPGGVAHEIVILDPGQVIDVFSPPRADYL